MSVIPDKTGLEKLSRCVRYLRGTKDILLILKADRGFNVKWWVDALFMVHTDMHSQTRMTMTVGKGSMF